MKTENMWNALMGRFLILFKFVKPYERPSNEKSNIKRLPYDRMADIVIKGEILPPKDTVMINELCGYTKTKVKVQKVYAGNCHVDEIIEICEPYYEGWYRGEKCLMVQGNYEPLHIGAIYTLLLSQKETTVETDEDDPSLFYQVS